MLYGCASKFHTFVRWQVFNVSRESQGKIEIFNPLDIHTSSETAKLLLMPIDSAAELQVS